MSSFTCHLPPALCKGKKRRIPALPSTARANAVPCSLKDKLKVHLERGGLKRQVSQITFCMSKKVFTIAILCWRGDNFLSQIVLFQSSITIFWSKHLFLKIPGILFTQNYCHFKADIQNYPKAPLTPSTAKNTTCFREKWSCSLHIAAAWSVESCWRTGLLPGKCILKKYGAQKATKCPTSFV